MFHTWRVELSSSMIEYHEFLDDLLQPFLSNRKQSAMSMRRQEENSGECSAVTKPKS